MTNYFRDLRDDCVSQGAKPVHPVGNPIRYSTKTAGGYAMPNRCAHQSLKFIPPPLILSQRRRPAPFPSQATGRGRRGNDPHSFANEMGANGTRWYIFPLRIEPDAGQVCENSAEPCSWPFAWATKQVCDVLHDDESGSKVASKSDDLRPEAATRSINALLDACNRDILAGEAASNDVNGSDAVSSKSLCGEASNIVITGNPGKVDFELVPTPVIDLAERNGLEPACSLKAQAETAYSAEKVEDAELAHHIHPHALAITRAIANGQDHMVRV